MKLPQLAGLRAVHQPVELASLSVRKEVSSEPNAGTIQRKQMIATTSLTDQCAGLPSPVTDALRAGPAEPGLGGGGSGGLDGAGHRLASWSRNCRTWKIMTGMIAIIRMTTMAAA